MNEKGSTYISLIQVLQDVFSAKNVPVVCASKKVLQSFKEHINFSLLLTIFKLMVWSSFYEAIKKYKNYLRITRMSLKQLSYIYIYIYDSHQLGAFSKKETFGQVWTWWNMRDTNSSNVLIMKLWKPKLSISKIHGKILDLQNFIFSCFERKNWQILKKI